MVRLSVALAFDAGDELLHQLQGQSTPIGSERHYPVEANIIFT